MILRGSFFMKTNLIPALVTLSAGAVYCIIGLSEGIDGFSFAKELLIVLIIFYVVGIIVKIILDKNFKDFDDQENQEENADSDVKIDEKEDISTDSESSDEIAENDYDDE